MAEFTRRFGGATDGAIGAHLVEGFFKNGGGRAWVTRVVSAAATGTNPAAAVLTQRPAASSRDLVEFSAGYRGQADPGPWANGYQVRSTPTFLSGVGAGADVTGTGATLASVSGFSVGGAITLAQGTSRHITTVAALDVVARTVTFADPIAAGEVAGFQSDDAVVATAASTIHVLDPQGEVLETFENVTWGFGDDRYVVDVINGTIGGSRYVMAADERSGAGRRASDGPAEVVTAELEGGAAAAVASTDYIGDVAAQTGLRSLDAVDIQLLTTDTTDPNVVRTALDYCAERDDAMYVGSVPEGSIDAGTAIDYGAQFQGAKVYGALYGPWIKIVDATSTAPDPTIMVPPVGHVMGVYARTEATRGIAKAPAGDQARVFGAVSVGTSFSDAQHTDLVERGSINGVRFIPGAGIVVDSSRTLSTDTRWRYVNVRLLFNYVKSSLRVGLRWVRQEPNRDTLWTSVKYGSVRPFLMTLWQAGAFGTGEPDDVFTIVVDESNNPPDQVDLGFLNVEVTFYPSKPAEKIVIRVGQQPSGAVASES